MTAIASFPTLPPAIASLLNAPLACPPSAIGQRALQRASQFLGSVTHQSAVELGIPSFIADNPANQSGLCATFVASILSQSGFPDLSTSVQPMVAFPDNLRAALLARGFTHLPINAFAPPGSIVSWPYNEHAAFLLHTDGQTMTVLNSNTDYRHLPQTVRLDQRAVALEQRAVILRPPL